MCRICAKVTPESLAAISETILDPIDQQIARVSASRANAAKYSVAIHPTAAKRGASEEVVEALRTDALFSDPKHEAVRRFAAAIASTAHKYRIATFEH
jgi:alkylhydroperoxidase family enzyme